MSKLRINLQLMLPGKKPVEKPVVVQPNLDLIMTEVKNKFQLKKKDMSGIDLFIIQEQDQPVSLAEVIDAGLLSNGMSVYIGQPPAIHPSASQSSASLPVGEQGTDDEDYYDAEGSKLLAECKGHRPLDVIWQHPETKACLYCGNISAAGNLEMLQEHGITRIVNCTANLDNYYEDSESRILYLRINMSAHIKVVHTDQDAVMFVTPMLDFVNSALSSGLNVLLHCRAGAHRAGTAAIICLMHFGGLADPEAIAEARRRRVAIDMGFGGMGAFPQLMNRVNREWVRDRRVKASNSYDIDYIGIEEAEDDDDGQV